MPRNGTSVAYPVRIEDYVPVYILKVLLQEFYDDTGQPIALMDSDARDFVLGGEWCHFCRLVRSVGVGNQKCLDSDRHGMELVWGRGEPLRQLCHAGLWNFYAPIRVGDEVVCYMAAGQIRGTYEGQSSSDSYASYDALQREWMSAPPSSKHKNERLASCEDFDAAYRELRLYSVEELTSTWERFLRVQSLVEGLVNAGVHYGLGRLQPLFAEMRRAQDFETLAQCILNQLSQFVEASACSIFLVQPDPETRTEPRLVLRATSWRPLTPQIQQIAYKLGEGLTGWVWEKGQVLRLRNIQDRGELARYPGLQWARKSDDSNVHREFLAVPIFGSGRRVLGVIRMPMCKRKGEGFTVLDEIAAHVAAQEIGRVLEDQMNAQVRRIMEHVALFAVRLDSVVSFDQAAEACLHAMKSIFPLKGARYYFHRVRASGMYWEVTASIGDLPLRPGSRKIFSLDEGLAGKAIRERKTMLLTAVRDKQPNEYLDITEKARSAIVTPVYVGPKCLGALAIVTERTYAFAVHEEHHCDDTPCLLPETVLDDAGALELIARVVGASLAHLKSREDGIRDRVTLFRTFASAAEHALRNWLVRFEETIGRESRPGSDVSYKESLHAMRKLVAGFSNFIMAAEVHTSSVSAKRILESVISQAASDKVKLSPMERDALVQADLDKTTIVINEVIANGMEHGRPPVTLWTTRDEMRPNLDWPYFCVHIQDSGTGIATELLDRVFDCGVTCLSSHTGMGLFFCRNIVELQGGFLECDNSPKGGAHFRLYLKQMGERHGT